MGELDDDILKGISSATLKTEEEMANDFQAMVGFGKFRELLRHPDNGGSLLYPIVHG
jgi:hypothetical protein